MGIRRTTIALLTVLGIGGAAHVWAEDHIVGLGALGPPLTAVGTKIRDPNWLVAYLLEPSRMTPGTSMPDFGFEPAEALAIAAALLADGSDSAGKTGAWKGGNPRTGERLFVARGCRGCHAVRPGEHGVSERVPSLAGAGLKLRGAWIAAWLASPRAYHSRTAMPRIALTDDEIRHLVAFVLEQRAGEEAVAEAPRFDPAADRARGVELLEHYECSTCHTLRGLPAAAPPYELTTADGTGDRDALLHDGRMLVAYYNCRGCHSIEGRGGAIGEHLERKTLAPPTLTGEGARVQPSWLRSFLQHPVTLRPWLEIRMPDYELSESEASVLARYFAAAADVEATDEPLPAASEESVRRGLRRFAHFKCVQCHRTERGATPPVGADAADLAIDLSLAKKRLRPSWMRRFLARPKEIAGTATRMPAVFYTSEGSPRVDDPEGDIDAITTFVMRMSASPETLLAELGKEREEKDGAGDIDWSTYEY